MNNFILIRYFKFNSIHTLFGHVAWYIHIATTVYYVLCFTRGQNNYLFFLQTPWGRGFFYKEYKIAVLLIILMTFPFQFIWTQQLQLLELKCCFCENRIPFFTVPFMYPRIFLADWRWDTLEFCIYFDIITSIRNSILGRVWQRYSKESIILLYLGSSIHYFSSIKPIFDEVHIKL